MVEPSSAVKALTGVVDRSKCEARMSAIQYFGKGCRSLSDQVDADERAITEMPNKALQATATSLSVCRVGLKITASELRRGAVSVAVPELGR